jgi:hypothetical protein
VPTRRVRQGLVVMVLLNLSRVSLNRNLPGA